MNRNYSTSWAIIIAGFNPFYLFTFDSGSHWMVWESQTGAYSDGNLFLKQHLCRAQTKGWFDSLLINNQTEWFKNQIILVRKWFIIKSRCNFGNILSKTLSKAVETLGKERRHDSDEDLNVTSRQSVDILESLRLKWDWAGLPLQSLLVCSMSASAT